MINFAAMVVMKAVWGQGHGRERSYEQKASMGVSSFLTSPVIAVAQLSNCPQNGSSVFTAATV